MSKGAQAQLHCESAPALSPSALCVHRQVGICWREGAIAVACLPSSHSSSRDSHDSTTALTPLSAGPRSPLPSVSLQGSIHMSTLPFLSVVASLLVHSLHPEIPVHARLLRQIVMDHRSICAVGVAMSGNIASSPASFDGGLGGQRWKCVCFFGFLKSTVSSKENSLQPYISNFHRFAVGETLPIKTYLIAVYIPRKSQTQQETGGFDSPNSFLCSLPTVPKHGVSHSNQPAGSTGQTFSMPNTDAL